MWRVDRTFLFFGGSEPGTGAGPAYRNCGERIALFFFFGWRSEPGTGAYRNCGGSTALFFFFGWSEPRTGARPSLQKMWRVDRAFFFFLGLNLFFLSFPLFPSLSLSFPLFPSFSIFLPLFTSFYLFSLFFHFLFLFLSFYLFFFFFLFFFFLSFFHIFFSFHHLFHIISFCFLFSLSFSHSFSHFRWPGRGRSLAALPCLPLPYLTLHLLSSPSLTPSRFSADFCAE